MQLYSFRNGHSLNTHAAANYTRNELATALRKARLHNVFVLIFFLSSLFPLLTYEAVAYNA